MGLGDRLKRIRKEMGLSQKDMAQIMGVSLRVYQRYESDEQKPSYDKVAALLNDLKDINPAWLLTGEGSMLKVPDVPGIEDEEREILDLLRENPELKPLIVKILKAAQDMEAAVEEIKKISLEKNLKGGLQNV